MKLSGNRNQCPSCGEFFNSVGAFDKHRTGEYGKPVSSGTYSPSSRRCLSVGGMVAIGMEKNASGFWISSPMPTDIALGSGKQYHIGEGAE